MTDLARRIRSRPVIALLIAIGCASDPGPRQDTISSPLTLTNQKGRLTSTGNGKRRTTFAYDDKGRTIEAHHAIEGAVHVYTERYGYPKRVLAPGATELGTVPQSTELPDGEVVAYEYDSGGQMQKLKAGTDVIVSAVKRNARGQTTSVVYGNNVESVRRYADQGNLRLRQIVSTHRPPGGTPRVLQAYDYTFDAAGNTQQILDYCNPETDQCPCDPTTASCTALRLSRAFEYDEQDQLTRVKAPAGMTITGLPRTYAYDVVSNLTQKDNVTQTYGAGGKPHAIASAGGVTHDYDLNGNLISTSAGLTLAWDGQNMPVLAIKNGQRVRKQFVGKAVWKKLEGTTTTLYLPSARVENGKLRKQYMSYAERDPDAGSALRFYHGDHLGSSTLVTDATARVVHRAVYLAYGEDDPSFSRSNSFHPKYQFNLKEKEETTGLYDYGARMYNPATGRWTSPDPSNVDGLNRYAYVRNNPVRYIDPTGRFAFNPQQRPNPSPAPTPFTQPEKNNIPYSGPAVNPGDTIDVGKLETVEIRDTAPDSGNTLLLVEPGSRDRRNLSIDPLRPFRDSSALHVTAHADRTGPVYKFANGTEVDISPSEIALMIKAHPFFKPGVTICFHACELGQASYYLETLARLLPRSSIVARTGFMDNLFGLNIEVHEVTEEGMNQRGEPYTVETSKLSIGKVRVIRYDPATNKLSDIFK